jgi:hypothetical protein
LRESQKLLRNDKRRRERLRDEGNMGRGIEWIDAVDGGWERREEELQSMLEAQSIGIYYYPIELIRLRFWRKGGTSCRKETEIVGSQARKY